MPMAKPALTNSYTARTRQTTSSNCAKICRSKTKLFNDKQTSVKACAWAKQKSTPLTTGPAESNSHVGRVCVCVCVSLSLSVVFSLALHGRSPTPTSAQPGLVQELGKPWRAEVSFRPCNRLHAHLVCPLTPLFVGQTRKSP